MNIDKIGIRSYEKITSSSTGKRCKGTIMIVRGKNELVYPPSEKGIAELTDTDLRDKLNSYSYFSEMSEDERKEYLDDVAISNPDLYLSEVKDVYVKFLQIGFYNDTKKNPTPTFSQETINMLMRGNPDDPEGEGYWSLDYVYNLFPKRPGTKRRHTLVFRPDNWILMEKEQDDIESYNGICVNIETGDITYDTFAKRDEKIYTFDNIAILVKKVNITNKTFTLDKLIDLSTQLVSDKKDYTKISKRLSIYPPSFLKSLLQKIIRYRPDTVEEIDARIYLLATFITLYTHSGAFVADIQRYVTGKESATKRLAISIIEDSYVENHMVLYSLLAYSLLIRGDISYSPSEEIMLWWMEAALYSLSSTKYYIYDCHSGEILDNEENQVLNSLLNNIGTFETDINMVSTISNVEERRDIIEGYNMSITHAVDQHCYTDVAWLIDLYTYTSYSSLFKDIWTHSSSLNPRKPKYVDKDIFNEVKRGQQLFILAKESSRVEKVERSIIEGSYTISHTLADMELAVAVGIVGYKKLFLVISPHDILDIKVAKMPTRPGKDKEVAYTLSDVEYEEGVKHMRKLLSFGISTPTHPLIKKVRLEDDTYFVTSSDEEEYLWNEYKQLTFSYPLHEEIEKTKENSISTKGKGVEINADNQLASIYNIKEDIRNRFLMYLEVSSTHISPYKIGRDGTGTKYRVSVLDTHVYNTLMYISLIYPATLVHSKHLGFEVKDKYLLEHIINLIKENSESTNSISDWVTPKEEIRKLYDHQLLALKELAGRRRSIMWMAPGMGKTAIITSHISQLIEEEKMPLYCIYTTPPSALKTILREFESRGIPHKSCNEGKR